MIRNADLTIVYLVHKTTSVKDVKNFSDSYRKWDAGATHRLLLILKGMGGHQQKTYLSYFVDINFDVLRVPDEGMDISTYIRASSTIETKYSLFMNSHSIILTDDYAGSFLAIAEKNPNSLIGSFASYESVKSSWRLMIFYQWFWLKTKLVRGSHKNFGVFEKICPLISYPISTRLKYFFWNYYNQFSLRESFESEFEALWASLLKSPDFSYINDFSEFPNPHVRTNCFFTNTNIFKTLEFTMNASKEQALKFESGTNGLLQNYRSEKTKVFLNTVGGALEDEYDWSKCSFRNPIGLGSFFSDNHSREYEDFSESFKKSYTLLTWGENSVRQNFKQNVEFLPGWPDERVFQRTQEANKSKVG